MATIWWAPSECIGELTITMMKSHKIPLIVQGWGLLSQFLPFHYFPGFSNPVLPKNFHGSSDICPMGFIYSIQICEISHQTFGPGHRKCPMCQMIFVNTAINQNTGYLLNITFISGVGVTKAPFVNFSVSKIFDLARVLLRLFDSHLYLTGATAAELRRHLSNINVIFNR